MNHSEVLDQTYLRVSSDLKSLDKILAHLENLNHTIIPPSIWLECQLALVEAFTNAVRHAHKNLSTEVPIEIEIILFSDRVEFRLWDYGNPFDLEAFMSKLPPKQDNLSLGGRGLTILNQIADFLTYTRTDDSRNCLLIIKKLHNRE